MPKLRPKAQDEDPNDILSTQLKELGFGGFADLAQGIDGLTVSTVPTGFPSLDKILCERMPGMPRGRDVEIYSDKGSSGKSTLAAALVKGWQHATHAYRMADDLKTILREPLEERLKTAWIEIEGTTGLDYLYSLGVGLWKEDVPGGYSLRYWPPDSSRTTEDVLNMLREFSKIFDLIVVDSVAALCNKADIEKTADETNKIAGLPQLLGRFYPKNTVKKATILWLNQTRSTMQTNQAGRPITKTVGGQAQTFYPSIKLDLFEVEKIKDGEEVWGVRTKAFTAKNKISPQYRSCLLPMILGHGYSTTYDYMMSAIKAGIIQKKTSWLTLRDENDNELFKIQGEQKMFEEMERNQELRNKVISLVDGEDVEDTKAA